MADSNQGSMAFVAETVAGTTPATPVFKNMRITSENLVANFETLVSQELNTTADVGEVRRGGLSVSGDINFELHRDGGFEDFLAAALRGTWATNVLKTGVLRPSFTLERKIINEAAAAQYFRFLGAYINGFSLNITPDEFVTGGFRMTGFGTEAATTIVTGATYTGPIAASTNPPMSGIDVTSVAVSGATGVDFTSLTIDVDNNNRIQRKLAAAGGKARGVGYGRRNITGQITSYFETLTHYQQFLNNDSPSITAVVSDGTNSYTIVLPRVRITGGEVPNPGVDQDLILTLNYQAVYNTATSCSMQITRAP